TAELLLTPAVARVPRSGWVQNCRKQLTGNHSKPMLGHISHLPGLSPGFGASASALTRRRTATLRAIGFWHSRCLHPERDRTKEGSGDGENYGRPAHRDVRRGNFTGLGDDAYVIAPIHSILCGT